MVTSKQSFFNENIKVVNMQKDAGGQILAKDSSPELSEETVDVRVMTLNCWGLYGVSSLRKERMQAIASYLSESDFDIVLLQVSNQFF